MLRVYLWKEWREQRWMMLAAVLGCLPLGAAFYWIPQVRDVLKSISPTTPVMHTTVTAGAMILVLLLLAGNLVGRELQGRGFDLLSRMPGRIYQPLLAKGVIWLSTILAAGLLCLLFTTLMQTGPSTHQEHVYSAMGMTARQGATVAREVGLVVALAFVMGFWVMAASTWLKQSGLALPATILLVSAWWWPFLYMWFPSWHGYYSCYIRKAYPEELELVALITIFLVPTGILVTWITIRSMARTRSMIRAGLLFLGALIASSGASWGWTALRHDSWTDYRLSCQYQHFTGAIQAEGSPFIFLNTDGPLGSYQLVVDKRDGTYRQAERGKGRFAALAKGVLGPGTVSDFNYSRCFDRRLKTETICRVTFARINNSRKTRRRITEQWDSMTGAKRLHEKTGLSVGEHILDGGFSNYMKTAWNRIRQDRKHLNLPGKAIHLEGTRWLLFPQDRADQSYSIFDSKVDRLTPTFIPKECYLHHFHMQWCFISTGNRRELPTASRQRLLSLFNSDWFNTLIPGPDNWIIGTRRSKKSRYFLYNWRSGTVS